MGVRVLWLIKSLNIGGAERLLEVLAARRDPDRVDVEVAFVRSDRHALAGAIEAHGVPVHDLGTTHDLDLRWVPRLRRLIRERSIDLVHTHSPLTAAVARLSVRGVPHVYTEHNVWSIYHPLTRMVNAATYPRNAQVVAVSTGVARSVRRGVPAAVRPPITVIYHGFDDHQTEQSPGARRRARERLGLSDDVTAFGTVAIFRPQKRHALMIDAFASVAAKRSDVRLVLIGGGPLEEELAAHVRASGLTDRVVFTGVRRDTQSLIPGLDVFVLSSIAEGLPVSLLEAMAAGVPAVATTVGGIPEVVTDGESGILVPPEDVNALASALTRMLVPEVRARFAAASSPAVAALSISNAWCELLDVYTAVTGAAVPGSARVVAGTSPERTRQESARAATS